MEIEQQIGLHMVRAEGGIIFVRHVGDYCLSEAKRVTDLISEFHDRFESAYLLVDVKDLGTVEPAARNLVTEWFRDIKFEAVLLCGAGFPTRVVAKVIGAAAKMTRTAELPFVFVSSEKVGRALIADHCRASSRTPASDRNASSTKGRS
jgi:hypothetical protein